MSVMTFSKAITSQIYGKKVEKLKGDARVGEKFNFFVIFPLKSKGYPTYLSTHHYQAVIGLIVHDMA